MKVNITVKNQGFNATTTTLEFESHSREEAKQKLSRLVDMCFPEDLRFSSLTTQQLSTLTIDPLAINLSNHTLNNLGISSNMQTSYR